MRDAVREEIRELEVTMRAGQRQHTYQQAEVTKLQQQQAEEQATAMAERICEVETAGARELAGAKATLVGMIDGVGAESVGSVAVLEQAARAETAKVERHVATTIQRFSEQKEAAELEGARMESSKEKERSRMITRLEDDLNRRYVAV